MDETAPCVGLIMWVYGSLCSRANRHNSLWGYSALCLNGWTVYKWVITVWITIWIFWTFHSNFSAFFHFYFTHAAFCFLFLRISSIMWRTSRIMVWWRSLTPKGMMHGKCTLRKLPRKSWMSLPCVMESSPSTRLWRRFPADCPTPERHRL